MKLQGVSLALQIARRRQTVQLLCLQTGGAALLLPLQEATGVTGCADVLRANTAGFALLLCRNERGQTVQSRKAPLHR